MRPMTAGTYGSRVRLGSTTNPLGAPTVTKCGCYGRLGELKAQLHLFPAHLLATISDTLPGIYSIEEPIPKSK